MKVQKIITLLISMLVFSSCSEEDLTCKDFKEGTFEISYNQMPRGYDSTLIRKNNRQIEKIDGSVVYVVLDWIDECSYTAKYDESKTEKKLLNYVKEQNDNKGIVVSKVKIEGRCFYFKSVYSSKEGEDVINTGRICKK
jgi:major membrane immunogen (membrane-anchored lipoprotein)